MTQLKITRQAVRKPYQKRRKSCPFSGPESKIIDYKDVKTLSKLATSSNNLDDLLTKKISNKDLSVKEYITEMIASIGENINLRRMKKITNDMELYLLIFIVK